LGGSDRKKRNVRMNKKNPQDHAEEEQAYLPKWGSTATTKRRDEERKRSTKKKDVNKETLYAVLAPAI